MTMSITAPRVNNRFLSRDMHFLLLLGGVAKRHSPDQAAL
jgi:hypothetical protein